MEDKFIYLVFSKTGTWLSRSIGFVTQSDYTHVSLSLDPQFNKMYTFGRTNPDNPFSGGLTIEDLSDGVYEKSSNCHCLIYEIAVNDKQMDLLRRELDYFYGSDIKYKYNFIGLFGVLMDKPLLREHHYFCSEFITTLLNNSGIWQSPKAPELTRPTDLMLIENKKIVYEGLVTKLDLINAPQVALL